MKAGIGVVKGRPPDHGYRYVGTPVAGKGDDIEDDTTWEVFREDIPAEDVPTQPAKAVPVLALAPAEAATDETQVLSGMKLATLAMSFYLSEEEWDEVDQAIEVQPEVEPVSLVSPERATEAAVTESAVRALLTIPAGTEILAAMAEQAHPALKPTVRASRSRSRVYEGRRHARFGIRDRRLGMTRGMSRVAHSPVGLLT
ncbi:hypothetical protein AB0H88_52285 [Nonomuraea sp. NPDC050680]|uniref:hypothetical protein n=1 Tax=Nonomuraea sp. NPDC050680 TaxID=3154630 RepID=UPI0033DD1908